MPEFATEIIKFLYSRYIKCKWHL